MKNENETAERKKIKRKMRLDSVLCAMYDCDKKGEKIPLEWEKKFWLYVKLPRRETVSAWMLENKFF